MLCSPFRVGLVVVALLGAGCGQARSVGEAGGSPESTEEGSARAAPADQVVPPDPVVPAANLHEFAAALLREASVEQPGNLVLSPASFALAFALAEAGAQGRTREEIAALFGFERGTDIGAVLTALSAPSGAGGPTLTVANGFFETGRLPIRPEYKARVQDELKSDLRRVSTENLAAAVNDWVSEKTAGRISGLVPRDAVTPDTVAILVNAIYLLARWQTPLHEVGDWSFDGVGSVPMMGVEAEFQIAEGEGYRAIRLPYLGGAMSMLIVVPDDVATFDAGRLAEVRASLTSGALTSLTMPKWEFETVLAAVPTLRRLGLTKAFDPAEADFCLMIGGACQPGQVWVSGVFHQANINVDTEGTEASAATAIVVKTLSGHIHEPRTFAVDRPFLFEILHEPTATPLFIGRVIDPS